VGTQQNDLMQINQALMEMPSADGLSKALDMADITVRCRYLSVLENAPVLIPENRMQTELGRNVRVFHLGCITYAENENIARKCSALFHALADYNASAVYWLRSDGDKIDVYLGTASDNPADLSMVFKTLKGAFEGNFPGSEVTNETVSSNVDLLNSMLTYDEQYPPTIAAVSCLTEANADSVQHELRGLETLVDSMRGERYDILVLASSVSSAELSEIRDNYETLYTQLTPFSKNTVSISQSNAESYTHGISTSISKSVTKTRGTSRSFSQGQSVSRSMEDQSSRGKALEIGGTLLSIAGMGMLGSAGLLGEGVAALGGLSTGVFMGGGVSRLLQLAFDEKKATETKGDTKQFTTGDHEDEGHTDGTVDGTSDSSSNSVTNGRTCQLSYENRAIRSMLDEIDTQIQRLEYCESAGAFRCAAYVVAPDEPTARRVSGLYRSIMTESSSSSSKVHINIWNDHRDTAVICDCLKQMKHPYFQFSNTNGFKEFATAATVIPTLDMPRFFALPQKSLPGLMVTKHAEFSRNIPESGKQADQLIRIGKLVHMGKEEKSTVLFDLEQLRKHVFIAGAPGSGKSNFCYHLLNCLMKKGVHFLVIEPAKGEYASVLGGCKGVHVYGTNASRAPLLRINPFAFPEGTDLSEHLDKLMQVFNTCWPMYAAMPAILKDALEKCYASCGWDLDEGTCNREKPLFPTFRDLMRILPDVIEDAGYSSEVQSNYKGALLSRVKSMSNGILGRIFCGNEIPDEMLFDKNVCVDISRLGSEETKSLIMGMLIIRMTEYRVQQHHGINEDLQHVTLLEEAHHLLRKHTASASMESADAAGLSTVLLTNAIAEMRTYGEGFLIADQTPSCMEEAVISNTSAKVVFRLPNVIDRMPVGNAMGLNEEQMRELSLLDTGIAVVHQGSWSEPVLCKIDFYSPDRYQPYIHDQKNNTDQSELRAARSLALSIFLANRTKRRYENHKLMKTSLETLSLGRRASDRILYSCLDEYVKRGTIPEWKMLSTQCGCADAILDGFILFEEMDISLKEWNQRAEKHISRSFDLDSEDMAAAISLLIMGRSSGSESMTLFYTQWFMYSKKQRASKRKE